MPTVERINAATGVRMLIDVEPDPVPPPTAGELLAYAAAKRWECETGGVMVADVAVATDDTSQRKIAELRRRAELGEIALPFGFKADSGWIDLHLEAIVAIDQAVAAHVQACYAAERSLGEGIAAGTVTTAAEVEAAFAAVRGRPPG